MKTLLTVFLLTCGYAFGANIIHNSSFEVGASGWTVWGSFSSDTYGNESAVADHVVSTNNCATHGAKAMFFRTRLYSRPFWLTNGSYTLTFDARSDSAYTLNGGVVRTWLLSVNPADTFSITTTYKRFTNSFSAPTNGWYFLKLLQATVPVATWVDSVQLERGATASAYAPGRQIEVGMSTADSGNNLFLSDAKTLRFNFWNSGASTNVTVRYDIVHGVWNTNLAYGTISTNALTAGTNTTINLTLPSLWGAQRITSYITNLNETWDETTVSLFPYPPQSGRDTNGLLGIHAHSSPYHLAHARRIGFSWNRLASPNLDVRWNSVFPTLTTTNIYPPGTGHWLLDYTFEVAVTNDLVPYVLLTTGNDNEWYPQTNASVDVMVGDWTNYVGRMVHRYSAPEFNVKHWEVVNEPQQNPRGYLQMYDPAVYANFYTNSARLIKAIDPNAFVIGFGGYSQGSQGEAAWSAFTPQGKTDSDALSFHFYPTANGLFDPNLKEDYRDFSTANYDELAAASFFTSKPIWNTETAVRDSGGYHTIQVAYAYPFYWGLEGAATDPPWTSEAWFNELDCRMVPSVERITYNFLRSIGWGMRHFNIQNGRMPDDTIFVGNHPTIYELNSTLKPWAIALLIANHFIKTPGLGRITNTYAADSYWIEAYGHTNTLGSVVPIWCFDKGNRTLTITNGAVALYDTMGNLIVTNSTTIPITRTPRYLVSGSLTYAQLKATVESAIVSTNQDTTPPGLTIDLSPIGNVTVWAGITNAFKALAIDETVNSYASAGIQTSTQTNVQYRWSLSGGTNWSPWGATNHFYHSFPAAGMYDVRWQAKDLAGNTSSNSTPYFGALEPLAVIAPPSSLRVSGTARIGTITVP